MIRNYRETDLEACRDLHVRLTEWHRKTYDSPSIGGDNPGLQFDDQLAKVVKERIRVAESEEGVVGMIGLQPGYADSAVEIEPLVAAPGARGQGVGRALVQHVIEVVKGMGLRDVNVHVVGRNAEAIRFYHDVGFDLIGYFELMYDTSPREEEVWRDGETVAGRRFRV